MAQLFFPTELNRLPSKLDPMPPSAPNPPVAPISPVINGISVASVEPDAGMVDAAPAAAPAVAAAAVPAPRLNGRHVIQITYNLICNLSEFVY